MAQTDLTCTLKTEYQETHIAVDSQPQKNNYNIELPQSVIESFAQFLVPEITEYYSNPICNVMRQRTMID